MAVRGAKGVGRWAPRVGDGRWAGKTGSTAEPLLSRCHPETRRAFSRPPSASLRAERPAPSPIAQRPAPFQMPSALPDTGYTF